MAVQITPQQKIMDCLERLLGTMTQANGWRTDGIVIDRSLDPRIVAANKAREYAQKNAVCTINLGGAKYSGVGGEKNVSRKINFWVLQSLTDAEKKAGITLDMIEARLTTDLVWLLDSDSALKTMAAELNIARPNDGFGIGDFSCTYLHVEDVLAGPVNFPETSYQVVASCEYKEFRHKVRL